MPKIEIPTFTFTSTRRRKSKTAKSKKTKVKAKKPVILKRVDFQTGPRKSLRLDKQRKALPPGKRRSRYGRIYYETRRNRSDLRKGI